MISLLWKEPTILGNLTNSNAIITFHFNDVRLLVWQDDLALRSSNFTSRNTMIITAYWVYKQFYPRITRLVYYGLLKDHILWFHYYQREPTILWHYLTKINAIVAIYFKDVEMLVWQDILALCSIIFASKYKYNNCI